jgi:hypothetical protein
MSLVSLELMLAVLRLLDNCCRSPFCAQRPLLAGSGCSSRVFERSLCGIKLAFTWQGSLGPQQPIFVAVPQRAISVTVSIRKWSRV